MQVLGPVIGGFLAASNGWRWTSWLLAILGGAAEIATVCVMRETSPKIILEHKASRLRVSTGNARLRSKLAHTLTPQQVLAQALVRPSMLLIRSPVVLALSLYAALVFGVIYLLFTTFNGVFRGQYGFSASVSGLVYLGLGIALVLGVVIFGNLNPRIQAARMKADGVSTPKPEYRLLLMIWLSPCVALGLFIYGWTAYYKVHWIVPIIGTFFIGLGAYFVLVSSVS
jgi:predicted MFS family arabinose efflux permease